MSLTEMSGAEMVGIRLCIRTLHTHLCQFQNIESLIKAKVILRSVSRRAFLPNPQRCQILSEV